MLSNFKKVLGLDSSSDTIADGAYVVDVRSKAEYASGHVKCAVNIPLELIENNIEALKAHNQVVVYCRSGNRSEHAKRLLNLGGHTNVINAGSLEAAHQSLSKIGSYDAEIVTEEIDVVQQYKSNKDKDTAVLKVLIPTDFSVQSDFAFMMVQKLEEHLTIEPHFVHIIDVPDTVTLDGHGNITTCGDIDGRYVQAQVDIAEQKLKQIKEQHGDHIQTYVRFGKLTDTINLFSSEMGFDLVVMGTKGTWGLKEKLTTTKSQLVVRKSQAPVLTLMCDRSDLIINDVLYVHDFSDDDNSDVPIMHKFSDFFHATFHLLHINDVNSVADSGKIENNMKTYAENHNLQKYKTHILAAKDVEEGVKEFLKKQDADIVFIGTHGKGGKFHKSYAEALVKHLFKPIVTFHFN
ncbi:MAG: universal stress protein [Chitinophagales bacterium]|nr:universal stress protein [Chitinophagales bacterium]